MSSYDDINSIQLEFCLFHPNAAPMLFGDSDDAQNWDWQIRVCVECVLSGERLSPNVGPEYHITDDVSSVAFLRYAGFRVRSKKAKFSCSCGRELDRLKLAPLAHVCMHCRKAWVFDEGRMEGRS